MPTVDTVIQTLAFHEPRNAHVVGSYSARRLWPSDVDVLITVRAPNYDTKPLAVQLLAAVHELAHMPLVRPLGLKAGGTPESPKRWSLQQLLSKGALMQLEHALEEGPHGRIKLDIAVFDARSQRFVEVSGLYHIRAGRDHFGDVPSNSVESFAQERDSLVRSGDYWKALKRTESLEMRRGNMRNGNKALATRLQAVFDGPLGALAQSVTALTLLDELASTCTSLPAAKVVAELDAYEALLLRIDVAGLPELHLEVTRDLHRAKEAAVRMRSREGLRKLGRLCAQVARALDAVLQTRAKTVWRSLSA
jgi:hypothetical protein